MANHGGSIFKDVLYEDANRETISVQNNLKYDMTALKLGKNAALFYDYPLVSLRNIKVVSDEEASDADLFVDAHILITKGVTHSDLNFLRYVELRDEEQLRRDSDFTRLSDVAPYLNGYGRVVYFTDLKQDARGVFNPLMPDQ